jgi:hypothetical protein
VSLERGPLSLVSTTEELLGRKSSGSGLENREYGRRNPSRWPRGTLYPQKLALNSRTSGDRSVGIVRSRSSVSVQYAQKGPLCRSFWARKATEGMGLIALQQETQQAKKAGWKADSMTDTRCRRAVLTLSRNTCLLSVRRQQLGDRQHRTRQGTKDTTNFEPGPPTSKENYVTRGPPRILLAPSANFMVLQKRLSTFTVTRKFTLRITSCGSRIVSVSISEESSHKITPYFFNLLWRVHLYLVDVIPKLLLTDVREVCIPVYTTNL